MKLFRYGPPGRERPAVLTGRGAVDVTGIVGDFTGSVLTNAALARLAATVEDGGLSTVDITGARIGPPIASTGKIVCVGLNYRSHAEESQMTVPDEPIVFMKSPDCLNGPDDDILLPPDSRQTDYEVELAVVIGQKALYLPDQVAAQEAIAGYTISNDLSERSWQLHRGGQWVKGKSFPSFNPLGPFLVTRDEFDAKAAGLSLTVNGVVRQHSDTSRMIFDVAHIVHYVSQFMALLPGDIINTGTPEGVALGRDPDAYLKDGDMVEATVEGIGTQTARVVAHQRVHSGVAT